jgi:hypothetical protein
MHLPSPVTLRGRELLTWAKSRLVMPQEKPKPSNGMTHLRKNELPPTKTKSKRKTKTRKAAMSDAPKTKTKACRKVKKAQTKPNAVANAAPAGDALLALRRTGIRKNCLTGGYTGGPNCANGP